jgi:arginine N-succinyltransferase
MGNKAFIAELMPKHPIYTLLLSREAQTVLGKVHPQTAPALHLLQRENFRMQGYIDIFDGGPTVEAPLTEIRSIKRSWLIEAIKGDVKGGAPHLVASTKLGDYRCVIANVNPAKETAPLPAAVLKALQVKSGDRVRVTPV